MRVNLLPRPPGASRPVETGCPEVAHALQGLTFEVEIEGQREVGVGGLHLQVGKIVDDGLYLGQRILGDMTAHDWLETRSNTPPTCNIHPVVVVL